MENLTLKNFQSFELLFQLLNYFWICYGFFGIWFFLDFWIFRSFWVFCFFWTTQPDTQPPSHPTPQHPTQPITQPNTRPDTTTPQRPTHHLSQPPNQIDTQRNHPTPEPTRHGKEAPPKVGGGRHHRPKGGGGQEVHLSFLVVLPSFSSFEWGCFSPVPIGMVLIFILFPVGCCPKMGNYMWIGLGVGPKTEKQTQQNLHKQVQK